VQPLTHQYLNTCSTVSVPSQAERVVSVTRAVKLSHSGANRCTRGNPLEPSRLLCIIRRFLAAADALMSAAGRISADKETDVTMAVVPIANFHPLCMIVPAHSVFCNLITSATGCGAGRARGHKPGISPPPHPDSSISLYATFLFTDVLIFTAVIPHSNRVMN
jgi:hypothetical protein